MSNNQPPAASATLPNSAASPKPAGETKTSEGAKFEATGGGLREIAETIVFVIMLVLLLKTFVAEAFVIPTGSMATTLYGDQKSVICPQCAIEFPVNCSSETTEDRPREPVEGCTCPNCRYQISFRQDGMNPSCRTGDRVMVAKFLYDLNFDEPERNDVVVFKFPREPLKNTSPLNYIKRLIGKPGETIGIHGGDVFVYPPPDDPNAPPLTYADQPRPEQPEDLWQYEYMYVNNEEAVDLFRKGKFQIVRKSPAKLLAMQRPVFDNDHQPKDLVKAGFAPRWAPEMDNPEIPDEDFRSKREKAAKTDAWIAIDNNGFRHPQGRSDFDWLRYRHLVVERSANSGLSDRQPVLVRPELITDFLGYDSWRTPFGTHSTPAPNWVGDLILECEVTLEQPKGEEVAKEMALELSRGPDRFRAVWNVINGDCNLIRVQGKNSLKLNFRQTALKAPGTYRLRFANVDRRLTVWIDGTLIFGDGHDYDESKERGPTFNDLEPASIGVRGAGVDVKKIKLWRDTYYTVSAGTSDTRMGIQDWSALRDLPVMTMYVQPGHMLCMGDNSPESSDGRYWGLVPRRLLLGRALMVYFPVYRIGPIQ